MVNHYERVQGGNFGDDLNEFLWEKIFGQPIEQLGEKETYFIGVGTRLRRKNIPVNKKIVVFGAGYGYETISPIVDENWDIRCVRGPLTAEKLKISLDKVITDPAILTALQYPEYDKEHDVSFIPHHLTVLEDNWENVCSGLKMNFINPTAHPDRVIEEIIKSKLVISESLHGAIIADSFRIPWIPVYTRSHFSKFKWDDWAASMELDLKYQYLHPLFNKSVRNKSNFFKYLFRKIYGQTVAKKISKLELEKCMKLVPYLSSEEIFKSRLNKMRICVSRFLEEYG